METHNDWIKSTAYYEHRDLFPDTLNFVVDLNNRWRCKSEEEFDKKMIIHRQQQMEDWAIQQRRMAKEIREQERKFEENLMRKISSIGTVSSDGLINPVMFWSFIGMFGLLLLLLFI